MSRTLLVLLALLAGCAAPVPPTPVPEPPAPPPPEVSAPAAPARDAAPAKIRAALARAGPREAALVAAPSTDAASIALVRQLDRNVRDALADLERDGGRHITPAAIKRAQTAITDLQNHLNEFQAGTP
jgi:hypothetical protein